MQQDMGSGVYQSGILYGYGNGRTLARIRGLRPYPEVCVIAITSRRSFFLHTHKSGLACLADHRTQTATLPTVWHCRSIAQSAWRFQQSSEEPLSTAKARRLRSQRRARPQQESSRPAFGESDQAVLAHDSVSLSTRDLALGGRLHTSKFQFPVSGMLPNFFPHIPL